MLETIVFRILARTTGGLAGSTHHPTAEAERLI
jgi:hypothetical protein